MSETFWGECDLVHSDPDRVAGKAVVKGTRVPADVILVDEGFGCTAEETHENFPTLPVETILRIRAYAHARKPQLQR